MFQAAGQEVKNSSHNEIPSVLDQMREYDAKIEQIKKLTVALRELFLVACQSAALPADLLLRSMLGERSVNAANVAASIVTYSLLGNFLRWQYGFSTTPLFIAAWVFVPVAILRYLRARRRLDHGPRWHSRSRGFPHLVWFGIVKGEKPNQIIQQWGEPGLVLSFGFWVAILTPLHQIGIAIAIAGVASCIRTTAMYARYRTILLDQIDEQIASEALQPGQLESERSPLESEGFMVPMPIRNTSIEKTATGRN